MVVGKAVKCCNTKPQPCPHVGVAHNTPSIKILDHALTCIHPSTHSCKISACCDLKFTKYKPKHRNTGILLSKPVALYTVPQVLEYIFLEYIFGVYWCFESSFLQYSSDKSQSWQECRQVTPNHSCRLKMFSKSNHIVIWCCLLPQFVVVGWFVVPNVLSKFLYIFCTECLKCWYLN